MRKSISNLGSIRSLVLVATSLTSSIYGHPLSAYTTTEGATEEAPIEYGSAKFFEQMVVVMILVLVGGAFAGKKKRTIYKCLIE